MTEYRVISEYIQADHSKIKRPKRYRVAIWEWACWSLVAETNNRWWAQFVEWWFRVVQRRDVKFWELADER